MEKKRVDCEAPMYIVSEITLLRKLVVRQNNNNSSHNSNNNHNSSSSRKKGFLASHQTNRNCVT